MTKKPPEAYLLLAAFLLKALAKRQMWLLLVHIKGVPASTLPASGQRPDALYLKIRTFAFSSTRR